MRLRREESDALWGRIVSQIDDEKRKPMTINRDAVWGLLRAAFPDPVVEITEAVVELTIRAMQHAWKQEYEDVFGITKPTTQVNLLEGMAASIHATIHPGPAPRFYLGHARHKRSVPFVSQFTAVLPHVRVRLPESGEPAIDTFGGIVYAGDHLLHNLAMVNDYLEEQGLLANEHFQAERVDLITPARFAGARFGAIAIYLLYRHASDTEPFGYVLEAGMATGEPRTTYFSPDGGMIVRRSFYQPTPDSSPKNYYGAMLEIVRPDPIMPRAGDWPMMIGDPRQLIIDSFRENPLKDENAKAYHTTTVLYEPVENPGIVFPALLTLQAACRVAVIEQAHGRELAGVGPLTGILADLGRQLAWDVAPPAGPA
jgi:hypothetical protein